MLIGVDLDNTIICYENSLRECAKFLFPNVSFPSYDKNQVKQVLIAGANGMRDWMKLQAALYTKGLSYAKLYPGLLLFFSSMRSENHELMIVSHKTEFGHFDESKINLREAALNFLEKNDMFDVIKKESVFFESTQEKKISRIKALKLDYFIDDLEEVLLDEMFPKNTKKVLFSPDASRASYIENFHCWLDVPPCLSAAAI